MSCAEYIFVYGDGLNRFYVAREHEDLGAAFDSPPNVFAQFVRASEVEASERASRMEAELAAIRATRSWRWTSPIRTTVALARRVRAAIRRS